MMNTLVQSMRSARIKKIKLTIIHQNLHPRVGLPCWPVYCTVYLFLSLCLLSFFARGAASNEIDAPLILATWDHLIVQQDTHCTPKERAARQKNEQTK